VATTLLAFLSTGCASCGGLWEMLAEWWPGRAHGVGLVVVTPSRSMEDEAELRRRAPAGALVHMGSETWFGYGVGRAGTFVLVQSAEGARPPWEPPFEGAVLGQALLGVGSTAPELEALVAQWVEDAGKGLGKVPQNFGPL
jgi:hypothetical protein